MATLYTIGHSTHSQAELINALQAHSITTLVDIRSIPMSRRMPHFNRPALEKSLPEAGIRYVWMKDLGGRSEKGNADSPHIALREDAFRNYADHMLTPEFALAAERLLTLTQNSRTAYMCAERDYLHCHRRMVSDWLVAHGHEVLHIDGTRPVTPHVLTPEARVVEGQLIYRGDLLF